MKSTYNFSLKILGTMMFASQIMNAQQVYTIASGDYYYPGGVTNDGVVSMHVGNNVYIWNQANGLNTIGSVTNGNNFAGLALISDDGKTISASITNPDTNVNESSIYDVSAGTWTHLGGLGYVLGGEESTPWGMTPDGNTIVGLGWYSDGTAHGVKWTSADGWTDLGSTISGADSRANAVSDDGNIIVGWQDDDFGFGEAVRWINGVQEYLTDTTGNHIEEPSAISADGKTVVGFNGSYAYIWNEDTGYQDITHPNASPFFKGGATAISADGKTVIGYYRPFGGIPSAGEGFIWTQETGRIDLNEYVESLGIDTHGITFGLPSAISEDGTKIAGAGVDPTVPPFGAPVAFLIDLSGSMTTQNVEIKKISVSPNPVKNVLNIIGANKLENIEIFNMSGQRVKSPTTSDKINVSELSKGIYILQFTADGKKHNIKFIKE
ncbi:MAG: T9SS type A sorting domain-containing protein [Flavobacteriaceae bacterium]|jgi:uncharacterized membrane protein|nr:T9SS type A sorting domain-containing protein [Flavobacteriaceae bacterium]